MSSSPWSHKTAVVCGASAGLGRDFAHELGRQRVAKLVLVSRSLESLTVVRDELQAASPETRVECLAADLRLKPQLLHAAAQIERDCGPVDLLIQAVGQSDRGRLADLSAQRLQELMESNILTSLHALQCFQSSLQSTRGSLVLVGSLASKFAPRFLGGYAIAKHGLGALAQQARLELAEQGVHVLLACPGPIARSDAGRRYDQVTRRQSLPEAARRAGGGAKVKGLDATRFVQTVLRAAARRKPQVIRPLKVHGLLWLSALSCAWGDRLLRRNSG